MTLIVTLTTRHQSSNLLVTVTSSHGPLLAPVTCYSNYACLVNYVRKDLLLEKSVKHKALVFYQTSVYTKFGDK